MGQTTWTGTQLGYALSGCRLAGGNLLLAFNEFVPDANTLGLWHMNEAAWNGTANEVVDASGNGHHGTAGGSATTVDAWMNRGGNFDAVTKTVTGASPSTNYPPLWGYPQVVGVLDAAAGGAL